MPLHIILVEDDAGLRYVQGKVLENAGYVVHPFADYHGVMELLDQGAQANLLLVDIALTEGTPHGVAVAGMVRMRRPKIPVLFMTAYAQYVEHVWAAGKVLLKPVSSETLLEAVASCLEGEVEEPTSL